MKRFTRVLVLLAALSLPAMTHLFAQEWSPAQKEVWKNVEAYWALYAQGNLDGFLSYMDADYLGWSNNSPLPSDKSTSSKFLAYDIKTTKTLVYDVKPVGIKIHGDFAFVDYIYTQIVKGADGKEEGSSGRWTDILMKEGDKWVMIGDHGGRTSGN
jgi:ketosteroid isomerase-like protein